MTSIPPMSSMRSVVALEAWDKPRKCLAMSFMINIRFESRRIFTLQNPSAFPHPIVLRWHCRLCQRMSLLELQAANVTTNSLLGNSGFPETRPRRSRPNSSNWFQSDKHLTTEGDSVKQNFDL